MNLDPPPHPIDEFSAEDFRKLIELNLISYFLFSKVIVLFVFFVLYVYLLFKHVLVIKDGRNFPEGYSSSLVENKMTISLQKNEKREKTIEKNNFKQHELHQKQG